MDYYIKNNIINTPTFFFKGVRDDPDINILKCKDTGALVLDKIKKTDYNKGISYWKVDDINKARNKTYDDDYRRYKSLENVEFKSLLDFGCGNGGLLKILRENGDKQIVGVELNQDICNILKGEDIEVYNKVDKIPYKKFDCIMLNHVLEHLYEPIEILRQIKYKMSHKTLLIIEVPHANDFLIKHYECEAFKKFTFWSEHLILHTEKSLIKLLQIVGFSKINIKYYQRYNVYNHLHWLNKGQPGGHKKTKWNDNELIISYNNFLNKNKMTDTLVAHCYI